MVCWPLPYVEDALKLDIQLSAWEKTMGVDGVFDDLQKAREVAGIQKMKVGEERWTKCVNALDGHLPRHADIVSRAYYKLIEIFETCVVDMPRNACLLCEAPGGFVQAIQKISNGKCKCVATSMIDCNSPNFSKKIQMLPNVEIHIPDDGDILKGSTRQQIISNKPVSGYELITGDGAYNNDDKHSELELRSVKLLASQLACALKMQARGGSLVLKFFSGSCTITQQLILLATSTYKESYIVKPKSSRKTNDERYLVCKYFVPEKAPDFNLPDDDKFLTNILSSFNGTNINRVIRQLATDQTSSLRMIVEDCRRKGVLGKRSITKY